MKTVLLKHTQNINLHISDSNILIILFKYCDELQVVYY